jgi:hypothetical protein
VKTASDFAASPGDAIGMSINMEKIHIFDKKTGKAIIV